MHEPVDHGGGDDVVAEDLAPAAEGLVAGDDQAGPFVAGGDELEEQVRGFGFERDVADLVHDEQRGAAELGDLVLEPAGVVRGGQPGDPFGGGGERDPVPGLAGTDPQPGGQVGFAGARSEGDRLHYLRSVLPTEVRVVALTHPLSGQLLAATGFKRLNGSLHLVVQLPDGSPDTILAAATNVWGELELAGLLVVLDVEGLRALRQRVEQLQSASAATALGAGKRK
jgi:hypothetical protein